MKKKILLGLTIFAISAVSVGAIFNLFQEKAPQGGLSVKNRPVSNGVKENENSKEGDLIERTQEIAEKKEEVIAQKPEILQGVAIGKRHKLPVQTQAQQKWFWCAPTTVSMILGARGKNVSQTQLASEMGTYEPFGTHNRDAIRILNRHLFGYEKPTDGQAGYRLQKITSNSGRELEEFKKRIIKNTQDGYPMYFTADPLKLYPGRSKSAEHNLAGAGYISTPDGKDVAFVYAVDPYSKFHDSVMVG